jgi:hypothetical protein
MSKLMRFPRSVKRDRASVDATALMKLIGTAYYDMKGRVKAEELVSSMKDW